MNDDPHRLVSLDHQVWGQVDRQAEPCSKCHAPMDAASGTRPGGSKPKAGDASICLNCGHVEVFTGDGLTRRRATVIEQAELDADPVIRRAQRWTNQRGRWKN